MVYKYMLLSIFVFVFVYRLKFQCLLIDFQVLIRPYSKFCYSAWLTCYNSPWKCIPLKKNLVSRHWNFNTLLLTHFMQFLSLRLFRKIVILKTSSRLLGRQEIVLLKTSSRLLERQQIFTLKTSSRGLEDQKSVYWERTYIYF